MLSFFPDADHGRVSDSFVESALLILRVLGADMHKPLFNYDLIQKYDVSGPRYTSYPTALQFEPMSHQDYVDAVATSHRQDRDLSLYLHLPFCDTICYYCACNKIVTKDKSKAVPYLEHLHREIDVQADLFSEDRFVSQLHWGGGTPTYINDQQMTALMRHTRERFNFRDDDSGEFSLEIDPRTVDLDRISLLRSLGFNRLSMGVQDFDPKVQQAVNRLQSEQQSLDAITRARQENFHSISVDLIYGLPHQSVDTFSTTLRKIAEMDPDRISIYNYAHMPQRFKTHKQINEADLPSPEEKLRILELCINYLTDVGYVYIGMDHFAKPDDELALALNNGTLHRNFQGYSTHADCDMVAMGITAISQIGTSYSQNCRDLEAYYETIDKGLVPVFQGVSITQDDLIRKAVIMSLICQFELPMKEISSRFSIVFDEYFSAELRALKAFEADGLVSIKDGIVNVSREGRLLIRNICMIFDAHINSPKVQTKFSKVI